MGNETPMHRNNGQVAEVAQHINVHQRLYRCMAFIHTKRKTAGVDYKCHPKRLNDLMRSKATC
eukprot:scaffold24212_cov19-Tisochrysis_lutea.AAC.1